MSQLKSNEGHGGDAFTVEVPFLFNKKSISFQRSSVEFDGKRLDKKSITKVYYFSYKHSVNLIPIYQFFKFFIASETEHISLIFFSPFLIFNKKKQEIYARLISLSKQTIEPTLIQNIVSRIFEKGEKVKIGKLEFDKDGYVYSKTFGGKETFLWSEQLYIPVYGRGVVILFKDKDGKGKRFVSVPMSTPNAVLLPELLPLCKKYFSSPK